MKICERKWNRKCCCEHFWKMPASKYSLTLTNKPFQHREGQVQIWNPETTHPLPLQYGRTSYATPVMPNTDAWWCSPVPSPLSLSSLQLPCTARGLLCSCLDMPAHRSTLCSCCPQTVLGCPLGIRALNSSMIYPLKTGRGRGMHRPRKWSGAIWTGSLGSWFWQSDAGGVVVGSVFLGPADSWP